jgi:hypothetical protein
MDQAQATLSLRDIHLPADPGYWPLAPGWWLLMIICTVIVYFLIKQFLKIRKRKKINHLLQQQLFNIHEEYKNHQNKHQFAIDIAELLRRFVKYILKDPQATSLTGKDWVVYLNNSSDQPIFSKFERELTQAQYLPNVEFDVYSLFATIKNYFPAAIKRAFKDKNWSKNHA